MNFYQEREAKACEAVAALLALPSIPDDNMYSDGECFDPWSLFPSLYGSYSKAFDDLALDVLSDIRDGSFKRADLAAEMFREILCTTGLCDYGTSPRVCFAAEDFKRQLPQFIERWREYSGIRWKQ